jgi:hypothetical protein
MRIVHRLLILAGLLTTSVGSAQQTALPSNLDPQPIIPIEDPKPVSAVNVLEPKVVTVDGSSSSSAEKIPTVDTEAPSPIAPQSYDGFDGVAQEPFGPTLVERQAMRQEKLERERKEQAMAEQKAELEKAKALKGAKRSLAATSDGLPHKTKKPKGKVSAGLLKFAAQKPAPKPKKSLVSQAKQPSSLRQPASKDKNEP